MSASLETRWLHADHAQALRELRAHRRACLDCEHAKRAHKPDAMCAEGKMLRTAEQELLEQAREAERLDAQPGPDQEALWELDELPGNGSGP